MTDPPVALIEDGKIVNAEALKKYWAERHDREYLCRRGLMRLWIENQKNEPVALAEVAPQPWDKRQRYQLDQTRAELISIKHKLFEMTTGKKLNGKPVPKPQQKSSYQGLVMNDDRP